ncbi:hypothetical protein [Heyndrickxia sporothermodurans]
MEGIMTKILLIVASIFLFVVVIVGVIQPSISDKGNSVKTSIDGTKLK